MDTCWYAVDETGELGVFSPGESGLIPMLDALGPAAEDEEGELRTTADWGRHQARHTMDSPWRQLWTIGSYLLGQEERHGHKRHAQELRIHHYAPNYDGYYYWLGSPKHPMRIESLPEPIRKGPFLVLQDYAFASREPINPLDYARGGFAWGNFSGYPWQQDHGQTVFPLPTTRANWSLEDYLKFAHQDDRFAPGGKFWFAVDDDHEMAVFRTDRFGAAPVAAKYDDNKAALFDLLKGAFKATPQRLREQPPLHWLEYPFGLMPPRLLGFYHYDASWHHPIPYCRVGVPEEPLRLDDPSWEWLEMWNPVRLPGVRFASAPLVQPLEAVECRCVSDSYDDEWGHYTQAEIWIDAAMEHVHLIGPDSVKRDDDERLLRRARRYVAMINELGRKG